MGSFERSGRGIRRIRLRNTVTLWPQAAFTLNELLVVIFILAVLAALLLPVLGRAKALALRVKCASNQRQIGVAIRMYVDDHQKYPSFNDTPGPIPEDTLVINVRSVFWDYKLLPFVGGSQGVFLCPANSAEKGNLSANWTFFDETGQLWPNQSYGLNGTGSTKNPSPVLPSPYFFRGFGGEGLPINVSESRIAVPADMIELADYDPRATDDDGDLDRHPCVLFMGLTGRHVRGANVLFCDSHVEYRNTNSWRALTETARQKWNLDHLSYIFSIRSN